MHHRQHLKKCYSSTFSFFLPRIELIYCCTVEPNRCRLIKRLRLRPPPVVRRPQGSDRYDPTRRGLSRLCSAPHTSEQVTVGIRFNSPCRRLGSSRRMPPLASYSTASVLVETAPLLCYMRLGKSEGYEYAYIYAYCIPGILYINMILGRFVGPATWMMCGISSRAAATPANVSAFSVTPTCAR